MDHPAARANGPAETFTDLTREQARNWVLQTETQLFLAQLRRDREITHERLLSACLANSASGSETRVAYRHELNVYDMVIGAVEEALGEVARA